MESRHDRRTLSRWHKRLQSKPYRAGEGRSSSRTRRKKKRVIAACDTLSRFREKRSSRGTAEAGTSGDYIALVFPPFGRIIERLSLPRDIKKIVRGIAQRTAYLL